MCVIIGGLRKNLRRAEQVEGMRVNRSGFSILVLRDKKVVAHQRSLREEDIMKVWDEAKDDDYVITHSRIPSAGGMSANLEDCHLWHREGCYFAHNGTMTAMTDQMEKTDRRTDSQYCFEEIFLPLWKSQGRNFNPLVERTMRAATYGNRICIVTPDGEVHYLGHWVEDHGCFMSNSSYKVTSYGSSYGSWPTGGESSDFRTGRSGTSGAGTANKSNLVLPSQSVVQGYGYGDVTSLDYELDGSIVRSKLDDLGLAKMLLTHLFSVNVESLKADEQAAEIAESMGLKPGTEEFKEAAKVLGDDIGTRLAKIGPKSSYQSNDYVASEIYDTIGDAMFDERDVKTVLENYAIGIEYDLAPEKFDSEKELIDKIEKAIPTFKLDVMVYANVMNLSTDWTQDKLRKVFTAYRMLKNRKGRPACVERRFEEFVSPGHPVDEAKDLAANLQTFYDVVRGKKG